MKLVELSTALQTAFDHFYDDFIQHDVESAEHYAEGHSNFVTYIQRLKEEAKGINLPDGYVPCSHFWLVNADNAILGGIRIRHHIGTDFLALEGGHIGYDIAPSYRGKGYGKLMLKLAIPKVKALGLEKTLLVADDDNMPSRKIIEANGGVLEDIVMGNVFTNPLARYWLNCQ